VDHVHCVNCEGAHESTDHECVWFKARNNSSEFKALQERKKISLANARTARAAARRTNTASLPTQAPSASRAGTSANQFAPLGEQEDMQDLTSGNA
jgi:hypothetical protein